MRKILILVSLIFAAAVAGILMIQDQQAEEDITAKTTRVGLILNGSHEDRNYNQTHFEALQSLQQDLNLKVIYREKVPDECYVSIFSMLQEWGSQRIYPRSLGECIRQGIWPVS